MLGDRKSYREILDLNLTSKVKSVYIESNNASIGELEFEYKKDGMISNCPPAYEITLLKRADPKFKVIFEDKSNQHKIMIYN